MRKIAVVAFAGGCLLLAGCGGAFSPVELKGAGATGPYVAYAKWIEEFRKSDQSVNISYQPTGSADGIKQMQAGTVDFAGTDVPLSDEQIASMKVKPLHFPTFVSAEVVVYNIPGKGRGLNLSGSVIAQIFLGKIKKWSDAAIVKDNPGAKLPDLAITVVHRSDGSGSTYAFTDFLSQVSADFKKEVGKGAEVKWPVGVEAAGSDGIAEKVAATPGAIGYLELNNAGKKELTYASVQNAAGKFLLPSLQAIGASLGKEQELPDDFRISLANARGVEAYPICTVTWLLIPSKYADKDKAASMRRFLNWAYQQGMQAAMPLDYGILPQSPLERAREQVQRVTAATN
jgi:phosphate transport system substrate-binding protein